MINEAAPLLNETNVDNVQLPRFRTPRTKCLCPGFMCEVRCCIIKSQWSSKKISFKIVQMWSFITATLLVFVGA